ncbi:GNAT family N-acetyltransferase [Maribacter sp. PR1]|uniref:GNAT family N-acetyltransferase n=1 Tax=Maribacter cobaltidurans TaxID=1178778 RepID=A0ABU7IYF7_9FLAO|nr:MULTISPECIES: GNAT family N-acetyltransferase [Maribacter]MDC6390635.1 GNAT family N-acetyltransferase [Maribacter sp. PR1]MEE1978027.1 GNAT family N-acetyltransferase [Maribacter cobaltidurans]
MNNIEIRQANKKDAKSIALLGRTTFSETFAHYFRYEQDLLDYLEATFSIDKIENSIAKPTNRYWVTIVNGIPAGYAKLKLNSKSEFILNGPVCQLQKIYILKDFLSMRIGGGLQHHLLEESKQLGFKDIWLSVLKENTRAINFYDKSGFIEIGEHNFQIGREIFHFFVMKKNLQTIEEKP